MSKYGGRSSAPRVNKPLLLGIAAIALLALGVAAFLLWKKSNDDLTNKETGCLTNRETPEAMLVLVDRTDKLTPENAQRIGIHIADRVAAMPRYSRLLIVPFGGDTAVPLKPIFDHCVPGKASDGGFTEGSLVLDEKYKEFKRTLDNLVNELQTIPDAKTSPITQQIETAAADSTLHWQGKVRSLYVVTDGLQSTIYWTKELHLKDPTANLLAGVKAEYFEVGNPKFERLQTRELRDEWKRWLTKAGADVRMDAPGYPLGPYSPDGKQG